MIAKPVVGIPIHHLIKTSREHHAHSIWIIDTFANRTANNKIELVNTNIVRQMRMHRRSPATDDGADPRPSGLAPNPDGHGTRQLHHSNHTHPIRHTADNNI